MQSWLNKNFRFVSTKVMDTAAQVANDPNGLSGDCTEVAMLLAAMCRAQGIPSRTAIGVIYADNPKPHFAFHMWTEIYIQGTWLGLDATLGRGSVGPGHIKVTDSSWEGERGQTPLMPVMQFIGKHPKIEVLKN
jgi:transglutaminase-like putative cysteine protease